MNPYIIIILRIILGSPYQVIFKKKFGLVFLRSITVFFIVTIVTPTSTIIYLSMFSTVKPTAHQECIDHYEWEYSLRRLDHCLQELGTLI